MALLALGLRPRAEIIDKPIALRYTGYMENLMDTYGSWVLAVIGVAGIYFVGRKDKWGWFVLLFNECLWIAYALATKQYGFILSALAYAAVYIRSYIHWSKEPVNELSL